MVVTPQRRRPFLKTSDPRTKLLCIIILTLTAGGSKPLSLSILAGLGILGSLSGRMRGQGTFRRIKGILILLILIPAVKMLNSPDLGGLVEGALLAFRFLVFLSLGTAFALNTKGSEVRDALTLVLSRIPFVPAGRIGTQIGLSIGSIPLIIEEANRIREAQISRLSDLRRNPVLRIARLVVPLFIGIFTRAQEMADAMESRSYSDERTLPELSFSKRDILLLLIVIPACAVCIFINTR